MHLASKSLLLRGELRPSGSEPNWLNNDRTPQSPCPHLEEQKETLQGRRTGPQKRERSASILHPAATAQTYTSRGAGTVLGELTERGRLDLGRRTTGHDAGPQAETGTQKVTAGRACLASPTAAGRLGGTPPP